jgi:hypothetical protein
VAHDNQVTPIIKNKSAPVPRLKDYFGYFDLDQKAQLEAILDLDEQYLPPDLINVEDVIRSLGLTPKRWETMKEETGIEPDTYRSQATGDTQFVLPKESVKELVLYVGWKREQARKLAAELANREVIR